MSSTPSRHRLLRCERGSTLVGYSSLMLLVAIAAIALLGRTNAGLDQPPRGATTLPRADRL